MRKLHGFNWDLISVRNSAEDGGRCCLTPSWAATSSDFQGNGVDKTFTPEPSSTFWPRLINTRPLYHDKVPQIR